MKHGQVHDAARLFPSGEALAPTATGRNAVLRHVDATPEPYVHLSMYTVLHSLMLYRGLLRASVEDPRLLEVLMMPHAPFLSDRGQ